MIPIGSEKVNVRINKLRRSRKKSPASVQRDVVLHFVIIQRTTSTSCDYPALAGHALNLNFLRNRLNRTFYESINFEPVNACTNSMLVEAKTKFPFIGNVELLQLNPLQLLNVTTIFDEFV